MEVIICRNKNFYREGDKNIHRKCCRFFKKIGGIGDG